MIEYPSPEPDLYPVHCGPAAWYPAEADVPQTSYARPGQNARVAAGDWLGYFRDRAALHEAENRSEPVQPVPEHTTRHPWPDDFVAPPGPVRFRFKAEDAGWETIAGYARSARPSVGRGVYRLHHYVVVQAQRDGAGLWARWRCPVEGKPSWSFDGGAVNGRPVETLTAVTDELGSAA